MWSVNYRTISPKMSEMAKKESQRRACRRCWGEKSLTPGISERMLKGWVTKSNRGNRVREAWGDGLGLGTTRAFKKKTHYRLLRIKWLFSFSARWVDNWGSLCSNTLFSNLHLGVPHLFCQFCPKQHCYGVSFYSSSRYNPGDRLCLSVQIKTLLHNQPA